MYMMERNSLSIKSQQFWNLNIKRSMKAKRRKQYACIGLTDNARRGMIVSICMSIKKIKSLHANTLFKKALVPREKSVSIAISTLKETRKATKSAPTMIEVCASLEFSNVDSTIFTRRSVKTMSMASALRDLTAIKNTLR